jgi:hypothetical protein
MFTICFNNARLSFSIFAFIHCHNTHSFVLSNVIFHYVPHVLLSNKCWKGGNQVSFLGYSQGFVVISHILFNMLEINVYPTIDSNVFWCENWCKFSSCHNKSSLYRSSKLVVEEEKCNLIFQIARMVLDVRG